MSEQQEHAAVEVDHDVCVGSGDCTRIAPDAFALDEDEGLAVVREGVHTTDSRQLEQAARECPTGAIRVSPAR